MSKLSVVLEQKDALCLHAQSFTAGAFTQTGTSRGPATTQSASEKVAQTLVSPQLSTTVYALGRDCSGDHAFFYGRKTGVLVSGGEVIHASASDGGTYIGMKEGATEADIKEAFEAKKVSGGYNEFLIKEPSVKGLYQLVSPTDLADPLLCAQKVLRWSEALSGLEGMQSPKVPLIWMSKGALGHGAFEMEIDLQKLSPYFTPPSHNSLPGRPHHVQHLVRQRIDPNTACDYHDPQALERAMWERYKEGYSDRAHAVFNSLITGQMIKAKMFSASEAEDFEKSAGFIAQCKEEMGYPERLMAPSGDTVSTHLFKEAGLYKSGAVAISAVMSTEEKLALVKKVCEEKEEFTQAFLEEVKNATEEFLKMPISGQVNKEAFFERFAEFSLASPQVAQHYKTFKSYQKAVVQKDHAYHDFFQGLIHSAVKIIPIENVRQYVNSWTPKIAVQVGPPPLGGAALLPPIPPTNQKGWTQEATELLGASKSEGKILGYSNLEIPSPQLNTSNLHALRSARALSDTVEPRTLPGFAP